MNVKMRKKMTPTKSVVKIEKGVGGSMKYPVGPAGSISRGGRKSPWSISKNK